MIFWYINIIELHVPTQKGVNSYTLKVITIQIRFILDSRSFIIPIKHQSL